MTPHHALPPVLSETPLSTHAAAKLLRTTKRTVIRWLNVGFKVNGAVVRLDGVMVGAKWTTSEEAVARFLEATAQARTPPAIPIPPPTARTRDVDAARRQLAALRLKSRKR